MANLLKPNGPTQAHVIVRETGEEFRLEGSTQDELDRKIYEVLSSTTHRSFQAHYTYSDQSSESVGIQKLENGGIALAFAPEQIPAGEPFPKDDFPETRQGLANLPYFRDLE